MVLFGFEVMDKNGTDSDNDKKKMPHLWGILN
jgi:hypothetical protein